MTHPGAPGPDDLRRDYEIDGRRWEPHRGGFVGQCWVVDDHWFVKVWPAERPPNLSVLEELVATGLPVVPPRRNRDGSLVSSSGDRCYAVYPYVRGRPATDEDWALEAATLRAVHEVTDIALPRTTMAEPAIGELNHRLNHPWIAHRRVEVASAIARLGRVIEVASTKDVRHVLCHNDFGGSNLLIDGERVVAILDWDNALLAPREHDVWIAAEGSHLPEFLEAYDATDLNIEHLEYALLARALRDMAARVLANVDRPGVDTWGFRRLSRLDTDLAAFAPFCSGDA